MRPSGLLISVVLFGMSVAQSQPEFWTQTQLLGDGNIHVYSILTGGQAVFAGTHNVGVVVSTDRGGTWTSIGLNDKFIVSLLLNGQGYLYASSWGEGVFRTTNGGMDWQRSDEGITGNNTQCLLVYPDGDMFAGTFEHGVFRSTDNGNLWFPAGLDSAWVNSMLLLPDGSILAASRNPWGVYKSTDKGEEWVFAGLDPPISRLAMDNTGTVFAMGFENIYRLNTQGGEWEHVATTNAVLRAMTVNALGHIYVGSESGVMRSVNSGNTWEWSNSGLAVSYVISIAVDSDGFVFAGTDAARIYRSAESTTSAPNESPSPDGFTLRQNYPNPFNPSTTFQYTLPPSPVTETGVMVTLRVYDVLGREVATLVNEKKEPSEHTVLWEANDVPSGVYYYRLNAGGRVETRKAILLK